MVVIIVLMLLMSERTGPLCTGEALTVSSTGLMMAIRSNKSKLFIV